MTLFDDVTTNMTLYDDVTTNMTLYDDVTTNLTLYDDVTTNLTLVTRKDVLNVLPPWEREGVFVTPEARRLMDTVLGCGVRNVVTVIGIPGNVFNIIVFAKQGLKDRINVLLFSLAIAELMSLMTLFVWRLDCYMETVDGLNWFTMMYAFVSRINRFSLMVSQLLVLLMTVDRCVAVTLPLKASSIITFRRMLVTILFIYVSMFAFNVPHMIAHNIVWQYSPLYRRHVAVLVIADYYKGDVDVALYILNIINAIVIPISVVVVIVLSFTTAVVLKKASRRRFAMMNSNRDHQDRARPKDRFSSDAAVTKMLLVLSFIYVFCVLPASATAMTMYLVYDFNFYRKFHNVFSVCAGVSITCGALKASANFFAYVAMSTKFRKTLRELLPCCGRVLALFDRKSTRKGSNSGGSEM